MALTLPFRRKQKPTAGFDQMKSAQMAAYLLQGKTFDKLKLIKLIYLAEREFLDRYSMPMTLDEFFSFKDGPVASSALDGINQKLDADLWSEWIRSQDIKVWSAKKRDRKEYDRLSNADIQVLDLILQQFGDWSTSRIWDYVHSQLPEYKQVDEGREPIRYVEILAALNKPDAQAIAEEIYQLKQDMGRLEA